MAKFWFCWVFRPASEINLIEYQFISIMSQWWTIWLSSVIKKYKWYLFRLNSIILFYLRLQFVMSSFFKHNSQLKVFDRIWRSGSYHRLLLSYCFVSQSIRYFIVQETHWIKKSLNSLECIEVVADLILIGYQQAVNLTPGTVSSLHTQVLTHDSTNVRHKHLTLSPNLDIVNVKYILFFVLWNFVIID